MKIVWVSGFLNSHLNELAKYFKENSEFYFIATENRKGQFGFGREVLEYDFVLEYFKDEKKDKCHALIKDADVVIFGGGPNDLIKFRANTDKLTFIYSERLFKKGTIRRFIPSTRKAIKSTFGVCNEKSTFVLCASAYLPYDLSLLSLNNGRTLKWGYFPQVKRYQDIETVLDQKKKNSILWAGRFLPLKHPEYVVKMAKILKDKGYDFSINFVGDGEMLKPIEQMINNFDLADRIHLLGKKTTDEVRKIMEESEIFLFTSNKKEGWGAVMNESMNSGCAVVASHQIGSAPILINEGESGLLFKGGNVKSLTKQVERLLNDCEERRSMGKKAYQFITGDYNAQTAGKRLIEFSNAFLNGKRLEFNDGPMSNADILKDNWYKG